MGLDMYLYADKYVSRKDYDKPLGGYEYATNEAFQSIVNALGAEDLIDQEWSGITVSLPVGYWRKANAIHHWIVQNCADGVDECQRIYVSRDKAQELLALCILVIERPSRAQELLPPSSGFFFGSTDIDEYYIWDLQHTVEILQKVLNSKDIDGVTYQASWQVTCSVAENTVIGAMDV